MCPGIGHVSYCIRSKACRQEGRSEDLRIPRQNPNASFHLPLLSLNFPRGTSLLFFYSGSLFVFSKTELYPPKETHLFMTVVPNETKYSKSREDGSLPAPISKQPTFQARHGLPRKTSTIITHPRPGTWATADKNSGWNMPSIQITSTKTTDIKHHTSTFSTDFLFMLYYMPKGKNLGQGFLLVQCAIDFLWEFLRTTESVHHCIFEVFVSAS